MIICHIHSQFCQSPAGHDHIKYVALHFCRPCPSSFGFNFHTIQVHYIFPRAPVLRNPKCVQNGLSPKVINSQAIVGIEIFDAVEYLSCWMPWLGRCIQCWPRIITCRLILAFYLFIAACTLSRAIALSALYSSMHLLSSLIFCPHSGIAIVDTWALLPSNSRTERHRYEPLGGALHS